MTDLGESQIYRDLMRFKPEGVSPNAWAVSAGVSRTVWTDMRRHGNPSRRTLEKLLAAAGSSLAEFEALRLGAESRQPVIGARGHLGDVRRGWTPAQLPPLPLLASSLGGEWNVHGSGIEVTELRPGELLDQLPRPISLGGDPDAYGLTIVGASTWPRFRPGRRIAVSPKAPVAIGDDVLVKLKTGAVPNGAVRVLIEELVRSSARGVELRQFNPDTRFEVGAGEIAVIEKVVGELI
jgi:hypothetical protein